MLFNNSQRNDLFQALGEVHNDIIQKIEYQKHAHFVIKPKNFIAQSGNLWSHVNFGGTNKQHLALKPTLVIEANLDGQEYKILYSHRLQNIEVETNSVILKEKTVDMYPEFKALFDKTCFFVSGSSKDINDFDSIESLELIMKTQNGVYYSCLAVWNGEDSWALLGNNSKQAPIGKTQTPPGLFYLIPSERRKKIMKWYIKQYQ